MVDEQGWIWPEWMRGNSVCLSIPIPTLNDDRKDRTLWVNNKGDCVTYAIKKVWQDIRQDDQDTIWSGLVWYSHCIPKHSFILWLAIHGRLSTQDRIRKWMPNCDLKCPLCKVCNDSHSHLFFDCKYSREVWSKIVNILGQGEFGYDWEDIVMRICSLRCNKNIASILRRLVLATFVYHIWQERNKRVFTYVQRSWEVLVKVITNDIRFKMASFQVKQTNQILEAQNRWQVKMNI